MSSHIQKLCLPFEAVNDKSKSYGDKVDALVKAWEHVLLSNKNQQPETIQPIVQCAIEYTLQLVLQAEFSKKTPQATKTHLKNSLHLSAQEFQKLGNPKLAYFCETLVELVQNPWSGPTLDKILNGQTIAEHEEEEFCCKERGEILNMRLKILWEGGCKDFAVNLAAAYVRSLRRNDRLGSLSETGHVHYMIDVYIVLLYKRKRFHDIYHELKLMDLKDGLELMQRLSGERPTKYGTAKVWRNSSKPAELVAQYLITAGMVRPIAEVGASVLEQILNSWALLHSKSKDDSLATLPGIIRKLIEPAESAQHIYIFCGVLVRHFGDAIKSLVIELYIRALTADVNELETAKIKSNKEAQQETTQRLSDMFLRLADYVSDSPSMARECVLTAFSLHPTRDCYERIRESAIACGKISSRLQQYKDGAGKQSVTNRASTSEIGAIAASLVVDTTGKDDATLIDELAILVEAERRKGETTQDHHSDSHQDTSIEAESVRIEEAQADSTSKSEASAEAQTMSEPTSEATTSLTLAEAQNKSTTESMSSADKSQSNVKNDSAVASASCDDKAGPSDPLDSEKLGISPQLRDDLNVVLFSQRYHVLSWTLEWDKLNDLCQRYLENTEDMRNTNKELKFLNIDYSQFKDHPDDPRDSQFLGIEKGYEKWDDSDYSESETDFKQNTSGTTTKPAARSLDDSSDSDNESLMKQPTKKSRPKKVPRLDSSDSDYGTAKIKKPRRFHKKHVIVSSSDSDTQDGQFGGLPGQNFRKTPRKPPRKSCNGAKKPMPRRRPKKTKITVDSMSQFTQLVNENIQPIVGTYSQNTNNDVITLFSADADETKRETIKATPAFNAAQLIITERRSDPDVIKSLRMFRLPHVKRLSQINVEKKLPVEPVMSARQSCIVGGDVVEGIVYPVSRPTKFAPMLSTLNLNPKIALRRVDEMEGEWQEKRQQAVSVSELNNAIGCIEKHIPAFTITNREALVTYVRQHGMQSKPRKSSPSKTMKSLLKNSVPGMRSMEFSVPPRMQSTVQVVQLPSMQRSLQPLGSNGTPPRARTNSGAGIITTTTTTVTAAAATTTTTNNNNNNSIQPPGTPSSGHDSGVGMSPADQTPPSAGRSSQDVGEEATNSPLPAADSASSTAGAAGGSSSSSSTSSNSQSSSNSTQRPTNTKSSQQQQHQQQQLAYRHADGTLRLLPSGLQVGAAHRSILSTAASFEDGSGGAVTFNRVRQVASTSSDSSSKTSQAQQQHHTSPSNRNAGLPKFQQAFGKNIRTLSTEASANSSAAAAGSDAASHETQTVQVISTQRVKQALTAAKAGQTPTVTSGAHLVGGLIHTSTGARQIVNIIPNSSVIYRSKLANNQPVITLPNNRTGFQVIAIKGVPFRQGTTKTIPAVLASKLQPPGSSQPPQAQILRQQPQTQPQQQQQSHQTNVQQQTQQQPTATATSSASEPLAIDIPNQQPMSSSVAEQLREFESVLEQVKERSSSRGSSSDTSTVQTQTHSALSSPTKQQPQQQQQQQQQGVNSIPQQLYLSTATPVASNGQFPQQEVYGTGQKVTLMYTNQTSTANSPTKVISNSTPVVVVSSYCQPAASPALSVTSQSSSSPCVTPAPQPAPSTGKQQPQSSSKSSKKSPKTVKVSARQSYAVNPQALKSSPIPKPQPKPQEDPETTQRIYAILGQYAEQLRNSPDLNNKPAPRRRSNPPTNPSHSSKRKKSGGGSSSSSSGGGGRSKSASGGHNSEASPSGDDMGRTMGCSSEDSSGGGCMSASGSGMMQVQDSPAGYSGNEETLPSSNNNSQSGISDNANFSGAETRANNATSDSNDGVEVSNPKRRLVFTEPIGQARTVLLQEALQQSGASGESLATKMTTGTAVLVSGTNLMLPMNFVKSGQQITVVSGGSKLLAAVPAVRTSSGASGVSTNAIVLQSLLSQATKVLQQQKQQQQGKLPQGQDVKQEIKSEAKPDAKTLGLFQQHTAGSGQQQRVFSSTALKLGQVVKSEGASGQTQQVVCIQTTSATTTTSTQKNDSVSGGTIALAVVPSAGAMEETTVKEENSLSPKPVKRKDEPADSMEEVKVKQSQSPAPVTRPGSSTSLDVASQYLVAGNSDSQGSSASPAVQASQMDDVVKIENGVLCSNARLQEAWEPENKGSPDTPWRYNMAPTNSLSMAELKSCSRDSDSSEPVHNTVLHLISPKNQSSVVGMTSSGVVSLPAKPKYLNSVESGFAKLTGKKSNTQQHQPNQVNSQHPTNTQQHHHHNRVDSVAQQRLNERKQQLIERELRLQKSLSEECEDLGVDEPSTSELFPDADLSFDTNHSPAFDHSSQEASCSHTISGTSGMGGLKSYSGSTTSFFKSLDSSASSRDASPVVSATEATSIASTSSIVTPAVTVTAVKKKVPVQRRTPKPKETQAKKVKRSSDGSLNADTQVSSAKQMRLSLVDNLSQDEASNSTSELSALSPAESSREINASQKAMKNGSSANAAPARIIQNSIPLATAVSMMNNVSEDDDTSGINLLEDSTANVSISSPMSPIAGPLLTNTHRYTYANNRKKQTSAKQPRSNVFFNVDSRPSWDSPMSEHTKSSGDEDDDMTIMDTNSQGSNDTFAFESNGLQDPVPLLRVTPLDHATYAARRKAPLVRRATTNHRDSNSSSGAPSRSSDSPSSNSASKKLKPSADLSINSNNSLLSAALTARDNDTPSPAALSDKLYDPSSFDEDAPTPTTLDPNSGGELCHTARRSSLRGHVKKGCGCCNGSPERPAKPKKPAPVKIVQGSSQQQAHTQIQLIDVVTGAPVAAVATGGKVKKIIATGKQGQHQHQQQLSQAQPKQSAKKR